MVVIIIKLRKNLDLNKPGLVETIGEIIGKKRPIISIPPAIGYIVSVIIGKFVDDIVITREEIDGLMRGLLYVDSPPTGKTKLTDWMKEHIESLGRRYSRELARRKDRQSEYKYSISTLKLR